MRPILLLLIAKEFGKIDQSTYLSAVTLEMLHTASLIHDDVVDESHERRGDASLNHLFGNKIAVLSGDYILSTAVNNACQTNINVVKRIADLGCMLSKGEIIQLKNTSDKSFSEESYLDAIKFKTAALFSMCAELGALSVSAPSESVLKMRQLGELIGICFQIRDDIFDYFEDNVGKPTGNDLSQGKLTLPLIYVLSRFPNEKINNLIKKVKALTVTKEERQILISYAKEKGGIEYAQKVMYEYADQAKNMLSYFQHQDVKDALLHYIDFVTDRTS